MSLSSGSDQVALGRPSDASAEPLPYPQWFARFLADRQTRKPSAHTMKAYQQDFRNAREALEEVRLDVAEGADMLMVKPAVTYLDILARVRAEHDLPIAAYHVSGEYAMVKAAAANGWIDGDLVALEQLTAVKRAGADLVLTYFAREIAEVLA